jgi:uncharacterized protein (DUF885 family)
MTSKHWVAAAAVLALWSCGKKPAETPQRPAVEAPAAAAAYDDAVKALTLAYFDEMPEMATYVGAPADLAPGAAARLSDRTPAGDAARRARLQAEYDRLAAVAPEGLDRRRALQRETILTLLGAALAPAKLVSYGSFLGEYGVWFTPYALWQNGGVAVSVPGILEAQQQIASAADAEAYLQRLSAYARMIDGAAAKLMTDADKGVVPPDFVIDKTKAVLAAFAAPAPAANVLVSSVAKKLGEAGVADAAAFSSRASAIVENEIYPAGARAIAALDALRPKATHDAGVWRLPQGDALYAALIRQMTDTDLTAEEIHQTGLREVDRILGEMDVILKAQGYRDGTVGERMRKLSAEPRFFYPNTEEGKAQILKDIAAQLAAVDALAPKWFGTLPTYAVEVRAVPAFSEASAPGGYYDSPALDGSRPGIYWINLRDTAVWPKYAVPTLTYHEAVPGHHFQTAISLGQDQPLILSVLYSNAFGEGWALYSEALAAEMGLYDSDPFGDLGRLQDELHRAIRLVVDTGMHAKRWSREQAIEYMAATEGAHTLEVESEIERFAVWPGQALGYKMGMLKIEALRKEAETALGAKFDIRAFHDLVLRDGAVPLPILERAVRAWIAAEKA